MKKGLVILISLLCLAGVCLWQLFSTDTNYYIVSVIILLASMLPFFVAFEGSKPDARQLALMSALIALAVVSRAVFYLLPQVKPIGAVVIVSAVCLGARQGYLIGVMSAFISNFIFGQGAWTPFQMVALGTVALIAGLIFEHIKPNRYLLAITGALLCFGVYGVIVDTCSVLIMSTELNLHSALAIYGAGVPFNIAFGVSTGVFLFLLGEPLIKKLNRIIKKYGIINQ